MWVDADCADNWNRSESEDRDTTRSRYGYVIMYEGCPILHKSQMQTEIALSSTESEYTGQVARENLWSETSRQSMVYVSDSETPRRIGI